MDPQVPVNETPSLTPMEKEAQMAYQVLTQHGFDYLAGFQLDEAQTEFVLALRQDPEGKRARLGLTKTLLLQCQTKKWFCTEADAHYQAILKTAVLTEKEKSMLQAIRD